MRTVYLGTSEFAAVELARLADSPHRPALVVTRPARPKGRGRSLQDPPVAEFARDAEIALFQPADVNAPEAVDRIRATDAEAIVVCAFGALVKEPLLSMLPTFNVHPSLLPRWRGAAPIERAIAAGDDRTGVSIMKLVEELDAGPFCAQSSSAIDPADDFGSLSTRLARLGGDLLVDALDEYAAGSLQWSDQESVGGQEAITYAEKITREDRLLTPTVTAAVEMERMIRALTPHIGAFFETTGGDPLRVDRAAVVPDGPSPGSVAEHDGRLLVGTVRDALELLTVRPAGGKSMAADVYLRGNPVPELAR